MCPYTEYWQNKISDTCDRVVNEVHMDGIYLDQVAAITPKPCYDKSHGHPMGGGHHWSNGNSKMFQECQTKIGN